MDTWLTTYKNLDFAFKLRTYIFSLPKNKLLQFLKLVEERLFNIPACFIALIKDLIAFRNEPTWKLKEVQKTRQCSVELF